MLYTLTPDNTIPVTLCQSDETMSILSDLALLLSTKRGTVPGYREFGLPMRFVGKPMTVAETIAAQEIGDAIAEFEIRAEFKKVEIISDENGKMKLKVEVEV